MARPATARRTGAVSGKTSCLALRAQAMALGFVTFRRVERMPLK